MVYDVAPDRTTEVKEDQHTESLETGYVQLPMEHLTRNNEIPTSVLL